MCTFYLYLKSARLAAQKKREQNQLLDSQKNSGDIIGGDESQLADDEMDEEAQITSQSSQSKPTSATANTTADR